MKILRVLLAFLIFQLFGFNGFSQVGKMPEPVTNNASALLERNGKPVIYSFYGLDSTKSGVGVHRKVYRYEIETGQSKILEPVPDSCGRLASSASVIQNKTYLAGGYAVLPSGKEKSSNHLFEFDPTSEKFRPLADIPIPIDDHIQTVWRDSLLYLISGWSDSVNVNTVQLFNPNKNEWKLATPLPEELEAKTFGGTGLIVGDTIYVLGGATFQKFYPAGKGFYKGAINPQFPDQVTWIKCPAFPGEFRYRSAAYSENDKIYFIGGSNETYNFNGISYAEKKAVSPNETTLIYDIANGSFTTIPSKNRIMDLRNLPIGSNGEVYTIGGMEKNQVVSDLILRIN